MATTLTPATGAEGVVWNLDDLYTGPEDPKFTADIDEALTAAKAFKANYRGKVASLAPGALIEAVKESERIESLITRAGEYAYLRFSTDTSDPSRGALLQKVQEQGTAISTEMLFFSLEWAAVEDGIAERTLADPVVQEYRHYLEAVRRYRDHLLSEDEEKLMAEKQMTGASAWGRLFEELTSAMRIKLDGEELPFEAAMARLQMPDPEVRRLTAEAITETLKDGLRTRGFIFNTLLLDKSTNDRLRNYPTWISARNLDNEASDESVQALVDAVVSRYDIPQRYYALKARLLGKERIADYDRLAPISSDSSFTPWDEARQIVTDAYTDFSPKVGSVIEGFFSKGWIDAEPTANKTPGAYCMTTIPWCHPYVLMSYTGDRRSILTLAHELGHGLHGHLAGEKLSLYNADTPLTMAETASVFGEALTFGTLLSREDDPKARLDLITSRLEDALATVFRQIAMNRFEDKVHNARRSQGELSVDDFAGFWYETQHAMLGDAVEITDGYKDAWWSYIPHFIRSPGYVYAYAFGCLFSLAIYQKYQREGDAMVEPYMSLLAAGGSDSPERLAKLVGLDLADPSFWSSGLESLDAILGEAEALAKQIS